jgi:anti-anti-sigma factor
MRKPASVVTDRVDVELGPAAAVVRVRGDLDLDVAPGLRAALERATAARPYVVVDLSEAGVIDAAGLGALVRARNSARRRQGELLLAGPSRFVQTVLRTMRLHTAFRSFGTVEQAVAAAHRPAPRRALAGTTS